jgi:hypothetical protein
VIAVDETRQPASAISGAQTEMLPRYLARTEDLVRREFVKVNCAVCHRVALLTSEPC